MRGRSGPPPTLRSVFPEIRLAIICPNGVVAAPTTPIAIAAGMSVTLFDAYAYDPAVVCGERRGRRDERVRREERIDVARRGIFIKSFYSFREEGR